MTPDAYRAAVEAHGNDVRSLFRWVHEAVAAEPTAETRYPIWIAVALYGRAFDERLLRSVILAGHAASELLQNPHLGDENRSLARDILLGATEDWAKQSEESSGVDAWLARPLSTWAAAGAFPRDSDAGRRLRALLDRSRRRVKEAVAWALISSPDTEAELLAWTLWLKGSQQWMGALAAHPNANIQVWRVLLSKWSPEAMQALAKSPAARTDPEVRPALFQYGKFADLSVLTLLSLDHVASDFPDLLRALYERGADVAARILAQATREERAALTADDLRPFLMSDLPEVRLAAIAASGEVDATSRPASSRSRS